MTDVTSQAAIARIFLCQTGARAFIDPPLFSQAALYLCGEGADKLQPANDDQRVGVEAVHEAIHEALQALARQIAPNAGVR